MTIQALTALAEACERAAEFIRETMDACPPDSACEICAEREADADTLKDHARAIREGRVTVHEGGSDD